MKKFFFFLFKNIHWIFFLTGTYFSLFLLLNNQQLQRSNYLMTVREIRGHFYFVLNSFFSYISLKDTNAELIKKLSEVETELFLYKHVLGLINDSTHTAKITIDSTAIVYKFIPAHVINNNLSKFENYIILDKGTENGIQKDMGVLSVNGIVGIVSNTSVHFSKVITLLNPCLKLSCKIKQNHFFGLLVWDGKDSRYTYLTELPSYVFFNRGDTVVTTGYSAIFPEGIPIGVIVQSKKTVSNSFHSAKVKLFTPFNCLHEVLVVKNIYQKEQNTLNN